MVLVLLKSIKIKAFQSSSLCLSLYHIKVQSHFPGLPHCSYCHSLRKPRTEEWEQGTAAGVLYVTGANPPTSCKMIPSSSTIHPPAVPHTTEFFPHHSPSPLPNSLTHIYTENTPPHFKRPQPSYLTASPSIAGLPICRDQHLNPLTFYIPYSIAYFK